MARHLARPIKEASMARPIARHLARPLKVD
jgi:hypothetical protein